VTFRQGNGENWMVQTKEWYTSLTSNILGFGSLLIEAPAILFLGSIGLTAGVTSDCLPKE
jgi:hypothetical protein